jgi:gas vesicle protein
LQSFCRRIEARAVSSLWGLRALIGMSFLIHQEGGDFMGMRAFLWGCAIGAGLGLLYAPRRGEETRADVQRWISQWQDQAQGRLDDVRDRATTVIEQGRQSVNSALDKAQSTTNLVADRAKEQVNRSNSAG